MRPDRYRRAELQEAYELGYSQMYDHDSFSFTERMELMAEDIAPDTTADALAAAYEGAADALRSLAGRAREAAVIKRAMQRGGL